MFKASVVRSEEELFQIHQLNQINVKHKLSEDQIATEGFLTWLYPLHLLKQMHDLAPSIIVKEDETVVAYALTTLKEARSFHPDLDQMFRHLEPVVYRDKPLLFHNYYCMGQICVAKAYRGRGLVPLLYHKHRDVYESAFDFLLTEISTSNLRSQKAHEQVGFKKIHSYRDHMDEWNVVVWDWKE
ncbi:MAG: GNAT family N-acetyltransferase [Flavisolibacter sp.]